MNDTLRPMNLGAILDRAIQIFRLQPMVFFGLAAIPGLAQMGVNLATVPPGANTGLRAGAGLAKLVFEIAHLILEAVSAAAFCVAASSIHFGGATTVRDAFNTFSYRKGRLVGLIFLQGIFGFWPLFVVGIVSVVIAVAMGTGPATIFVQVCLWTVGLIPCLILCTRYLLAFPATAIEDLPASSAIDRSVTLSEGGRMRILLGVLVPSVPMLILTFGSIALIGSFKAYSPLLAGSPLGVKFIEALVTLLATLVFSPYTSIVLTLLYYDQRIRREGYDVERMMIAAGLNPNADAIAVGLPAPAVPPLAHGVLPALAESTEGNYQA